MSASLTRRVIIDIAFPFPKDLYDMIIIRSGGRLDPVALVVSQVEQFVDLNRQDPNFWTDEGLGAFADEEPETPIDYGDPDKGEASKPGFVITLLNVHKPRDRTHYEQFRALACPLKSDPF